MTVALHNPGLVESLVSVDNAPVDAALKSDFGKYVRGMRKVEEAHIQKQSEADEILQAFEDVRPSPLGHSHTSANKMLLLVETSNPPIPPHQPHPRHRRVQ